MMTYKEHELQLTKLFILSVISRISLNSIQKEKGRDLT